MKRLLLLAIAAFTAATVAVAAAAGTQTVQIGKDGFTPRGATIAVGDTVTWHNADSVSLSASLPTVVYGNDTALTGSVSNQLASEPVTLTAQAFDKSVQSVDATQTTSNGAFRFAVSPTIRTTYQSHWLVADSRPVTVDVAPRVGFGRSGRTFVAKVTSDLTYSGRFVWVQRHFGFGWKSMKRVFLGANSRAVFSMKTAHGRTMLRLVLPAGQAGAGYIAGLSRTIVVHR